ncbi:hypothetical protein [Mageeibacillus indolicus]|uniref:hypothetical protein n=1 Tax=Mageeibacillus indolicus TaxID=884684 RepID=UPI00068FB37B|nr:hypothetical protein [Mageeibacillus indolicus]
MRKYDIALLGPLSLDINVEPDGREIHEIGGAVTCAAYAVQATGVKSVVLPQANLRQVDVAARFRDLPCDIIPVDSRGTTSIRNVYYDASHERRDSKILGCADGFKLSDLGDVKASLYHLGGLVHTDFSTDFILGLAGIGDIGADAQFLLRHADLTTGAMPFTDYAEKLQVLPRLRYLKVDAREAEIMTGTADREAAARQLYTWGAKEIFVSYHTEMMVFDGKTLYTCAYHPTSTVGRTGRGDTVFSTYLAMRLNHSIEESLLFATALVCLKIGKVGPFKGTAKDVHDLITATGMKVERIEWK